MAAQTRIGTVDEFMRCINRGDHRGALTFLHSEVEVVEPVAMPYAGRHVGHDGFLEMTGRATNVWLSWRDSPYPYSLACVGDVVFREHQFSAEVRATGAVVTQRFLEVAEFRADKIVRIRSYYFNPRATDGVVNATVDEAGRNS